MSSNRARIISNAAQIARFGLNVRDVKVPLSSYFAFPRGVIENIRFDTKGYKILLNENIGIKEIPLRIERLR